MSILPPVLTTPSYDTRYGSSSCFWSCLEGCRREHPDCDAECGVYPRDTTNRFFTDYQAIYQTPTTPNLQNLV